MLSPRGQGRSAWRCRLRSTSTSRARSWYIGCWPHAGNHQDARVDEGPPDGVRSALAAPGSAVHLVRCREDRR
jgi:hypothetical protein